MGKRMKINHKNDFNFKGGENFQRMDYLLKLSDIVYNTSFRLSKVYLTIMKNIAKRNTLQIERKFKKLICGKCNNLLYKDNTTIQRIINKSGKHILELTCGKCKDKSEIIIL